MDIRAKIAASAQKRGGSGESVILVAVTKTVPPCRIEEALREGILNFGENRVQEAVPKMKTLSASGYRPFWHFIGKLQRNKVRQVAGQFELIHSVDSLLLAEAISGESEKKGVQQKILMEINLSGEPSKGGFSPEETLSLVHRIAGLKYVKLKGFMTMPPPTRDPETSRPFFKSLKLLGKKAEKETGLILDVYSMGTSQDFPVAVEEGATHVRIGSAIFGERGG
jgi:hypothetical protein